MDDRFVELTRARLAAGVGLDDVLGELRRHDLSKIDSIRVVRDATGMALAEAKRLVHNSPAWADRRSLDEQVENTFLRALFVDCLVGNGQVNEPDERAAEYRERQRRATAHLRNVAANLPEDALAGYRRFMADNLLGRAFAALVDAGRGHSVPAEYWTELSTVADTLCLDELPDDDALAQAARLVRTPRNR